LLSVSDLMCPMCLPWALHLQYYIREVVELLHFTFLASLNSNTENDCVNLVLFIGSPWAFALCSKRLNCFSFRLGLASNYHLQLSRAVLYDPNSRWTRLQLSFAQFIQRGKKETRQRTWRKVPNLWRGAQLSRRPRWNPLCTPSPLQNPLLWLTSLDSPPNHVPHRLISRQHDTY
jgi:hypothetical protein